MMATSVLCGNVQDCLFPGAMDDLMVAQQLEHFQALRDRLRCKEIRVVGAHEWRNPDEDLPTDFRANRGRRQWDATE